MVFRPDLVKEIEEKVQRIRHHLKEAQARQKNMWINDVDHWFFKSAILCT
jgi:hypothetical protein